MFMSCCCGILKEALLTPKKIADNCFYLFFIAILVGFMHHYGDNKKYEILNQAVFYEEEERQGKKKIK